MSDDGEVALCVACSPGIEPSRSASGVSFVWAGREEKDVTICRSSTQEENQMPGEARPGQARADAFFPVAAKTPETEREGLYLPHHDPRRVQTRWRWLASSEPRNGEQPCASERGAESYHVWSFEMADWEGRHKTSWAHPVAAAGPSRH